MKKKNWMKIKIKAAMMDHKNHLLERGMQKKKIKKKVGLLKNTKAVRRKPTMMSDLTILVGLPNQINQKVKQLLGKA